MAGVAFARRNKRIYSRKNPLDKSTIFSIYPKPLVSVNPTIFPGTYTIPAGTYDKPSVTVIEPASWFKTDHERMEEMEVIDGSIILAESIIKDYVEGLHAYGPERKPGFFFIEGAYTLEEARKKPELNFKERIDRAKLYQENWYRELVKLADIGWARTNGNPLSISNDARMAAEILNLKEKPWMQDFKMMELIACPACGFLRNNLFPVCSNCRTILDPEKYAKLGLGQIKEVK